VSKERALYKNGHMELKSEPPKYAFTQHFVVFVYVFEHLDFEMKSGVELKLNF